MSTIAENNAPIFYQCSLMNPNTIRKETAFGTTWLALSLGLQLLSYDPDFPFWSHTPTVMGAMSVGYLSWLFKNNRDYVYEMTLSPEHIVGIRGFTMFGNPVRKWSYYPLKDLEFVGLGSTPDHFFVSLTRGEYFRMFRFELEPNVERLFQITTKHISDHKRPQPPPSITAIPKRRVTQSR